MAQIRAGRKMRREDGAKERRAGGRWGYMQVLSELWGSSRYINSFISAADSAGFLGYGKPRLSFNLVGPQTRELSTGVIHGFSEGRVSRARRGNEPFDQENMHLVFMGRACRDSRKKYIFPRIPVERSSESDSRGAKKRAWKSTRLDVIRMLDPDKKRNSQRDTVMRVKTSWFLSPPIMFRASIPFDSS